MPHILVTTFSLNTNPENAKYLNATNTEKAQEKSKANRHILLNILRTIRKCQKKMLHPHKKEM